MDLFIGVKYDGIDRGYFWWIMLNWVSNLDVPNIIVGLAIEDVAAAL